jgi:hypothetical protein
MFSLRRHPQDLVCPLIRLLLWTVTVLPQSHRQTHRALTLRTGLQYGISVTHS